MNLKEYLEYKDAWIEMTRRKINIRAGIILSILGILFIIAAAIVCSMTANITAGCCLLAIGLLQPVILIIFIIINSAQNTSITKFYKRRIDTK